MAKRQKRRKPSISRSAPKYRLQNFANVLKKHSKKITLLKEKVKKKNNSILKKVEKRPMISFFTLLIILFVLIALASILRRPGKVVEEKNIAKQVTTYSIGKAPIIRFQGKMEKSGIVKIVAQTPGVIESINITEGQEVVKGTNLIVISSNYSGGNPASIQRQISELTYQNILNTFDAQKTLINKQKELAKKQDENSDNLREITGKSIDDTKSLISLNENILDTLNSNLASLESSNAPQDQILSTKQMISQYKSALLGLNSQLKNTEYTSDSEKTPSIISNISREIAEKQLDIQEKALNLSKETGKLSLALSQISENAYFPSAPFNGIVERVYVTPGEYVNPGTPLLVLHGEQTLKLVVKVPKNIAEQISPIEESTIIINNEKLKLFPVFISTEATDGNLYSVIFQLPEAFQNKVSDNEYISIDLPVGKARTSGIIPFIPIDSVYQTENDSYVFINSNGYATTRKIELGTVSGSFVEVKSGLKTGDEVITTRDIIAGEKIKN